MLKLFTRFLAKRDLITRISLLILIMGWCVVMGVHFVREYPYSSILTIALECIIACKLWVCFVKSCSGVTRDRLDTMCDWPRKTFQGWPIYVQIVLLLLCDILLYFPMCWMYNSHNLYTGFAAMGWFFVTMGGFLVIMDSCTRKMFP